MAQATNPSIATGQTGTQYRTQDNDRYAAALTQHSGSTRPTYAVAHTLWLDTSGTPWILKMYDGADDISIGTVNASTNQFNASNAASTGSTIAMTAAINEAGTTLVSASTTDIGAEAGNYISVTGTTTITALGTVQVGTRRTVRFAGILTLTHNATSLILPGGANITTAAGDVATFISLGSGNWFCAGYTRAASIVSTLNVGTTAGNLVQLDGSAKLPAVDGSQLTNLAAGGVGAKIATNNPSGAASTSFTSGITSTYDCYEVIMRDVRPSSDSVALYVEFSTDGGSTWLSAGIYSAVRAYNDDNATRTHYRNDGNVAQLTPDAAAGENGMTNATGATLAGIFRLYNPAGTTNHKAWEAVLGGRMQDSLTTDSSGHIVAGGEVQTTSAINAIRFSCSSGNISGRFILVGKV